MKILVTGSNGFIAKNLIHELKNLGYNTIFEYSRGTSDELFEKYCKEAEFIFHLAGVNRTENDSQFMEGNYELTSKLIKKLKENNNTCPIILSSSIQAELNNSYGKSKKAGEELLLTYGQETGANVVIYRLTNVFGKWSKPNYNSVIATFCYNISREIPINISNPEATVRLAYIDDVVKEFTNLLEKGIRSKKKINEIEENYLVSLREVGNLIHSFKNSRNSYNIPDLADPFSKKMYSTYLSFLPKDKFNYSLDMKRDERGSFTEFIKTPDRGQVSINISKPGVVKGNHWHHTKTEKFLVINGNGVVRLRNIHSSEIIEYYVSGEKLEVIDIPVGYTHNIENLGDIDMVTVMWANELFDPENPDTFYLEV